MRGEWLFYLDDKLVAREDNKIVGSGLDFMSKLLINEEPNSMSVHMAMGTGATAVSTADTKLEIEGFRKVVTSKTRTGPMCRFRTFMLSNEANGDWKEFGIFLKSTDIAESGVLLNRVVVPISKASNQALTIEARITFEAT